MEDIETNNRIQLEQQRRHAHETATQATGTAWQQKFEIDVLQVKDQEISPWGGDVRVDEQLGG